MVLYSILAVAAATAAAKTAVKAAAAAAATYGGRHRLAMALPQIPTTALRRLHPISSILTHY